MITDDVFQLIEGEDIKVVSSLVNKEISSAFSSEIIAAAWAFKMSDHPVIGAEEQNVEAHLDMLSKAGAQFEHYISLRLAMDHQEGFL